MLLRLAGSLAAVATLGVVVATNLVTGPSLQPVIDPAGGATGGTAVETASPPVERWQRWTVHGLGLAMDVPASWDSTDGDPLARSGPSGHVRLAVATGHASAPELCHAEAARPGSPYGSTAEVTAMEVGGEVACRLAPGGGGTALAIVPVPLPAGSGPTADRTYLFVHADPGHIDALVGSVEFLDHRPR